jgi:hypothetical protein
VVKEEILQVLLVVLVAVVIQEPQVVETLADIHL